MAGAPVDADPRPPRRRAAGERMLGTALLALTSLVLASCRSDTDGPAAPPTTGAAPAPTTTRASPVTPTSARADPTTTTTPTATTNPPRTPELQPCAPDMGSTLQEQLLDTSTSRPPGETRRAPEEGFDWDHDGRGDRLLIGRPDGTVTLDWGTGRLTVTGVHTDFTVPVTDEDGFEYVIRGHGPSSAEELADSNRPAAVGDVTGDGWLDLIVTHRGTAAVLAGAGDQTPTGTLTFDRVGIDTPGWRSPPVRAPRATDAAGNPVGTPMRWPMPIGDVRLWSDVDGDRAAGFAVSGTLDRTVAPVVHYAGVPCATRPPPPDGDEPG